MTKLYLGNYIKKDKVRDALRKAKRKGDLKTISDSEIDDFVDGFAEVIEERRRKYGDKISHQEMQDIFKVMGRDRTDSIDNKELKVIEEILLDKKFIF